MNRKMRRSRLIGIILMGVAAIAIWVLVLSPNNNKPHQIEQQVASINSQKSNIDNQLKNLQQQAADLSSEQATVSSLSDKLPSDSNYPELYQQVVAEIEAAGMSENNLTSVTGDGQLTAVAASASSTSKSSTSSSSASSASSGTGLTMYQTTITISATGSETELLTFVQGLYSIPRTLAVDSVTLTPTSATGGTPDGTYNLTVVVRAFAAAALGAAPVDPDNGTAGSSSTPSTPAPSTPTPTPTSTATN